MKAADTGEMRLQNVNKSLYFKSCLLNVEMHKLGYWPENAGREKNPGGYIRHL